MNIRNAGYIVVFLFSVIIGTNAQANDVLSNIINKTNASLTAEMAIPAILPASLLPAVMNVSNNSPSCDGWFEVSCHQLDANGSGWVCQCQMFYCSSGWTQGSCP